MIGEILNAVIQEAKLLFEGQGGTVLIKTDYKNSSLPSYSMPLLIVDLLDANELTHYINGVTRADWNFAFNSYNYMPDLYNDDNSEYSKNLLNVIDDVRRHFQTGDWKSPLMVAVLENYGFKFTIMGINPADALEDQGLVMGYKIVFDSVAIDNQTNTILNSTQVLEKVTQL